MLQNMLYCNPWHIRLLSSLIPDTYTDVENILHIKAGKKEMWCKTIQDNICQLNRCVDCSDTN